MSGDGADAGGACAASAGAGATAAGAASAGAGATAAGAASAGAGATAGARYPGADANPAAGTDRTRVAAYAVTRDDHDRILLCHIAPSVGVGDIWTLPGGALEYGEPPESAVLRELAEETGYTGKLEGLVGVIDRLFNDDAGGGRLHAIRILYRVRIVGGELRDEPDGSTDMCRWFSPSDARNLRLGELARYALDHPSSDAAS